MTQRSLTKDERLSDDLLNASRNNDVATFEKCVRDGANVLCKNKAEWNVLHYIGLYRSYQLLCHVTQHHANVIDLINDVAKDGTTPLHMACIPSPPDIRVIEKFVRIGGDLLQRDWFGLGCKDKTHDRNTINFLQWRKLHPSGLPDSVLDNQKTADNDVIMKYLRTFAFMDDGFARRYELALQGRVEKSSNIRVIFLGPPGVGKTTMTYHLLETPIPEGGVDSTNMMNVDLNRLMINQRTGERIFLRGNDMERSASLNRLRDVLGTLSISEKTTKEGMSAGGGRSYSGDMAYVNIFDFGGEIMFSNFQHIFLNADAVIMLTFSLHNCLKDPSILETVYFWLKFISTYSIGKYRPPIVLVGTHLDEIPFNEREPTLETFMATIKSEKKNPDIAQIFEQHVVDVICISNLEPRDPVFEKLWKVILKCAPYQAQWNQLLPGHWIALEHDLMTLKSQGTKVMTFQKIKERAAAMDVTDVGAFLRYLNSARNILTFPTDDHKDLPADLKVILDPEWMIKAFRLIVTEIKYHIGNLGQGDPLLQEYQRTRRLKKAFIDHVWGKEDTDKFLENSTTLLYYIERSELIVKPLPKEDEAGDDVDTYIVPSMLQDQSDVNLVRSYLNQRNMETSSTLCINFKNKFIPEAVYDKFMASLLYRFEVISTKQDELLLQRGLACFILTGNVNMVVHCKENMIKVALFSKEYSFAKSLAVPIRTVLEKLLMSTLQRNDQGHLEYSSHIEKDFQISETDEKTVVTTRAEKKFWFGDFEVRRCT
ncbi:serine/threonine-protein kinase roco5 [Mizuhopecten yessoensis]|uniref:Serine/threonine-protein kinase roco5 n=1 Tax=Mizuhopecten yessoensis TaxID=6573 RepID=A0A210PL18_MIZYE|nr:serine/threonine-protein kinase roco5 [Mizuhopecten yessoensis]